MAPPATQISTKVTSVWTFRSGHVAGSQAVALPLLSVRYSPELDERNRARPGGGYLIPVEVPRQPGAGSAVIAKLTTEASYDGVKTWRTAPVTQYGTRWLARVDNPAGGAVSLRAQATDTDGHHLEQTTIRAYLVKH